MTHQYTDQQIIEAAEYATSKTTDHYRNVSLDYLEHFLDAIPEPDQQDDWQKCAWDDILHTDKRIKAEYIGGTVIEGVPDGISDEGIHLVDGNFMPHSTDAKWHRIPAPVQHPDPEVHAVIIVSGAYNVEWDHAYAYVSDGAGYNLVEPIDNDSRLLPEAIHNWTPAKVVADDA